MHSQATARRSGQLDLASLDLDTLASILDTVGLDHALGQAVIAEVDLRDRAEESRKRAAQARATTRDQWTAAAHQQYLNADAECRGCLLSEAGRQTGRSEWPMLWEGPESVARKRASWELNEYWDQHGRLTVTAYIAGEREMRRTAQDQDDLDRWDAGMAASTDTNGDDTDGSMVGDGQGSIRQAEASERSVRDGATAAGRPAAGRAGGSVRGQQVSFWGTQAPAPAAPAVRRPAPEAHEAPSPLPRADAPSLTTRRAARVTAVAVIPAGATDSLGRHGSVAEAKLACQSHRYARRHVLAWRDDPETGTTTASIDAWRKSHRITFIITTH